MDDQRPARASGIRVRFSILNLLLLTTIVALTIGWWMDHSRLAPKAALADSQQEVMRQHGQAFLMLDNKLALQSKAFSIVYVALYRMRDYDPEIADPAIKNADELSVQATKLFSTTH